MNIDRDVVLSRLTDVTIDALTASSTNVAKSRPAWRVDTPSTKTCFKASLISGSRRW